VPYVVSLDTEVTGEVEVVSLSGREAMSALSSWRVEILVAEPFDPSALLRKSATLRFTDGPDGFARAIPLVVTTARGEPSHTPDHAIVAMTLAPPLWLSSQRRAHRVFVDKTTKEIVDEVFANAKTKLEWRTRGRYTKRLQCVQRGETEWAFVERILAEDGVAYWHHEDDEGAPVLVLGDDKGAHDGIDGPHVLFREAASAFARPAFIEMEVERTMTTKAVHLRDFDVRRPDVFIESKAGEGPFERFEYPANVLTKEACDTRAKARLEQVRRDELVVHARGDTFRPKAGFLLEVDGCVDDDGNGKLLVAEATFEYRRGGLRECRARMVRADERTYRPAIPEDAPRVAELESVVTTGSPGSEIHVDDLGRVKIRWLWDRSGAGDDRSSAWVRTLQLGMGGSMILPRVGWEVAVAYQHGNPDVPVVLGRLYNASLVVPYALPGAAMKTTLQSATSPGGAGTNEMRMDDSAGKQEFFVHATKDQTVAVGGNRKVKIGNDETYDVGLSHGVTVKGSHTHAVGANQHVSVGTDHHVTVKGARTETVAAMENVDVTGNYAVISDSSYVEGVGALAALECNQANTKVQGAFTQGVGGSMNLAAGLGTGENVLASRSENVAGARIVVAKRFTEHVRGAKSVTAGAASDKAGQKVVTFTQASGTIKAGSMNLEASGRVVVNAPNITVDVSGTLDAGALSLAGGKLKASKGTTKLKGSIKRQGETKIE
jgi:type VI secretion system secreted protein VgrG